MLVLGIETATDVCAVGLVDGDRDLADLALLTPRGHSTKLAGLIAAALDAAGASPSDLGAVAVSAGPGSYTGLRIGASTAKGLCLATGAALVGVPTMAALAHTVRGLAFPATILTALPSRRGEVYAAAFYDTPGGIERQTEDRALALDDIREIVPPFDGIRVVGPAAQAVTDALADPSAVVPLATRPSGLAVARLGAALTEAGETEDLAAFEPAYLKPFVSGGA
ncbi:MAG: tRNA (adenosine(37)-N6)-threonylcarbamoyltransferase complex dimerization subunit type 1 TsaB [Bacteroidota bacterium]